MDLRKDRPVRKSLMIGFKVELTHLSELSICERVTCSKSLPVFCFEFDSAEHDLVSIMSNRPFNIEGKRVLTSQRHLNVALNCY